METATQAVSVPPRIDTQEFRLRQDRARKAAEQRSLSGLLAWGRGGLDGFHYADLYYLTNYFSNFPVLATSDPGLAEASWSARGHGALILPVDGPSTLVVDTLAFRDDLAVADEVIFSEDVVGTSAACIKRLIPNGNVGVMGSDSLSWTWHEGITAVTGRRLVLADDVGPELRVIKTEAELALLRAAGELGSRAIDAAMDAAVAGATEAEFAAAGIAEMTRGGGILAGLGISSGPYAHMYSQSQPAAYDCRYVLQEGDMARLDMYGTIDGYWFDIARGRVVGRDPNGKQSAVLDAAREAVLAGIELIRPGAVFADVAKRCQEVYENSNAIRSGLATSTGFYWGHSLGVAPEPPNIDFDTHIEMQPGMCMTLEKRIMAPGVGGTSHEDMIIVTEDGHEVISSAR